jgi:3'-phosphoadenosine 5'-phosphosulfate sulfotransferase (PAPS reductase)/FAD synthetase
MYERQDGSIRTIPNARAKIGTRGMLPARTNDMNIRWCSSHGKVDVLRQTIVDDERFLNSRTLILTGERREESPRRMRYEAFQRFHSDRRDSPRLRRHVDRFRPVLEWTKVQVWDILARWELTPHPSYDLGFGRASCRTCVFLTRNGWRTVRDLYPSAIATIADREASSGRTIEQGMSVLEQADRGVAYDAAIRLTDLAELADRTEWTVPMRRSPWTLPAGAFGENTGPG